MKKFKLSIFPAIEANPEASLEQEFDTIEELIAARETCANLLLFLQDEVSLMKDYSNYFIAETFEEGEWVEVEEGEYHE